MKRRMARLAAALVLAATAGCDPGLGSGGARVLDEQRHANAELSKQVESLQRADEDLKARMNEKDMQVMQMQSEVACRQQILGRLEMDLRSARERNDKLATLLPPK